MAVMSITKVKGCKNNQCSLGSIYMYTHVNSHATHVNRVPGLPHLHVHACEF